MRVDNQSKSTNPSFKAINLVRVVSRDEKNVAKALISGFDSAAAFERALKDKGISDTFLHSLRLKNTGDTAFYVLSEEHAAPITALNDSITKLKHRFKDDMSSDLFRQELDILINRINDMQKKLATFIITGKMPRD